MTSQEEANLLLAQHKAKRKERSIADCFASGRGAAAAPQMDEYERDLPVIRQVLERS